MSIACNLTGLLKAQNLAQRWFHRRAIFFRVLLIINCGLFSCHLSAASIKGPDIFQPSDDAAVVFRLTSSSALLPLNSRTPQEHLDVVEQALKSFRNTANPRYLGDAERELAIIPANDRNVRFYFFRASLKQSLHMFDEAVADLNRISDLKGDSLESLMMRFTINFVSGDYPAAEGSCAALKNFENNLYAASCKQQLQALVGPQIAYRDLKQAMGEFGVLSDRRALIWASGTLADIAERDGRDNVVALWQLALQLNRDNLYTRARLAEALLAQGSYQQVIPLTEDYLSVDALAVSSAIAQTYLGNSTTLTKMLRERFDEALWRGEILHKRAYAQFLLDIEKNPEAALEMAEDNWAHQREWPDALILKRAREALKIGAAQ
jgi:tetratricopeptide (TPR) repeat protein